MARLEWFVWGTIHEQFYARWADWFELQDHQHGVILWVLDRHHTTLEEALFRLDRRLSLGTSQARLTGRICTKRRFGATRAVPVCPRDIEPRVCKA